MKRALFLKEWRQLRPFLILNLAMLMFDIIDKLLQPLDTQALGHSLAVLSGELPAVQILFGFALGSGLLVREIDDGTLNFLDGLPLTRSAIFAAKIKAAMLVLAIYPLGLVLLHVLLHLAARGSLDQALHPGLLLTFFGLCTLVTAVSLALGLLLGFLRSLCWLVLGLCVIAILLLKDSAPSLHAALNPAELATPNFVGAGWQLPWTTVWTQIGATLLFALLAYALFMAAGRTRARSWPWARRYLLAPAMALMLVAGGAGLAVYVGREANQAGAADARRPNALEFTPIASGHATTANFTFSYPALSSARVRPFIAGADRTFTDVAALLRIAGGAPIDVDLSGTIRNHAGTAYYDRIRMTVRATETMDVLAHETTHVFARRLAGGERGWQLDGMTVFNEGLARWVERKLSLEQAFNEDQELAAAIVSQRRLITPRQLTDYQAFSSAVDGELKYPLGAALVDCFVRRYGSEAPKIMLQALARPDFPRDLKGYALWQTAFQLGGFDVDLVFDDYARYLKTLERKYARQIAALPRPRGSLVQDESGYAVKLRLDQPLPEDAYLLVRFRPGPASESEQYRTSYIVEGERKMLAVMPPNMITRGQVCFQPGVAYGGIAVYEPWGCLPVSSAR